MERLLIKAKAGDNYAIQLLLNKYKNLLNSASRQHRLISIQEEAYEEAVISFYQAIKDFNESLGVPFAGYAKVKVYQGVHTLFRRYLRIWQNEVSLSAQMNTDDEDEVKEFGDLLAVDEDLADSISSRLDIPYKDIYIVVYLFPFNCIDSIFFFILLFQKWVFPEPHSPLSITA